MFVSKQRLTDEKESLKNSNKKNDNEKLYDGKEDHLYLKRRIEIEKLSEERVTYLNSNRISENEKQTEEKGIIRPVLRKNEIGQSFENKKKNNFLNWENET